MLTGKLGWVIREQEYQSLQMSEEQLNASLDAEGAKPLEEGAAEDVELTDEELAGVAGGTDNPIYVTVGGYPD